MKTTKRKLLYAIMALLLCAGMLPAGTSTVQAKSTAQKAKEAKKAYSKIVNNAANNTYTSVYYDYVDINGDNIPELLLNLPENECRLYTWNSSKQKTKKLKTYNIGKMNNGISYWKKKHQVCFHMANRYESEYIVYSYKGNTFKKSYTIRFDNSGSFYNGKESPKKAAQKRSIIEKNFKTPKKVMESM